MRVLPPPDASLPLYFYLQEGGSGPRAVADGTPTVRDDLRGNKPIQTGADGHGAINWGRALGDRGSGDCERW